MPNAWFRCYSEILDDAKVQMMSEVNQRRLLMLFALRCEGKLIETFHETQIAFRLRISLEELLKTKPIFIENGFIDDKWNILNWNKRQYISDSSTERVRQHRERLKQDETLQKHNETELVTIPEQIQSRTDIEQSRIEKDSSSKSKPSTDIEQEEKIYQAYPRHVGKEAALKAIRKAVERLVVGDKIHAKMEAYEARKFLWKRAKEFSISPAGQKPSSKHEDYRPHPSTWFNEGRYFDENIEWQKPNGNGDNYANLSAGRSKGNLAVFAESTNGVEREEAFDPDGLFPASENGQGDTRTIHGVFTPIRPSSVPSGDGDAF